MIYKPLIFLTIAAGAAAFGIPFAQAQPDATIPQVTTLQNFTVAQPLAARDGDPNFDSATDKPHAGTPLSGGDTAAAPANPTAQPYQTPQWYKQTPQDYDRARARRHAQAAKAQAALVKPRPAPPSEEIAAGQQEPLPPQQEMPEDDSGQAPVYTVPGAQGYQQPAPRYYPPAPAQQQSQYYPPQGYADAQPGNVPQYGGGAGPDDYDAQGVTPAQQPLGAGQLEQLVAPIALYPDTLVAQVLTAATYPAQVSAAAQWIQSMQGASPEQIAAVASQQNGWDPSIKALTAFPQVLENLAGNLQWTTTLGNAYYNQPQDVLDTIQVMRQRADQAGNLQSTPQEDVTQDQGNIEIAPASPQVVYVPTYNPWMAYGAPVPEYPGFNFFGALGSFVGTGVQFGTSFGMGAFMHTPFGLLAWGLDWLGHSVLFNHGSYWTHSNQVRDWGLAHGGPRWGGGRQWAGNGGAGRFGDRGRFEQNYRNQPLAVHGGEYGRSGGENGRGGYGNSFAQRGAYGATPGRGYGGNTFARPGQEYGRGGYGQPGYGRVQPGLPQGFAGRGAYGGRPEAYGGRPQSGGWDGSARQLAQNGGGERGFGGGERGFGGAARPGQSYMSQPRGGYSAPQAFRGAEPSGGRSGGFGGGSPYQGRSGGFEGRSGGVERGFSSGGYGGGFAKAPSSGGFHVFGGGHGSSGFNEHSSSRAFGGGGHSFGGSHSFGGGGHSFGGGGHSSHSFGGGHSGGGHSSGHGGGHHR